MQTIDLATLGYIIEFEDKEIKLTGFMHEHMAERFATMEFDVLDISDVKFEEGEKEDYVCLGWSHCGPVYGRSYMRKINAFMSLVDGLTAMQLILPATLTRKQLNAIKRNNGITGVAVPDDARLFSMKDGHLYNKKGTILMFENKMRCPIKSAE